MLQQRFATLSNAPAFPILAKLLLFLSMLLLRRTTRFVSTLLRLNSFLCSCITLLRHASAFPLCSSQRSCSSLPFLAPALLFRSMPLPIVSLPFVAPAYRLLALLLPGISLLRSCIAIRFAAMLLLCVSSLCPSILCHCQSSDHHFQNASSNR